MIRRKYMMLGTAGVVARIGFDDDQVQDAFLDTELDTLDAPDLIPAGSMRNLSSSPYHGAPTARTVTRGS